MIRYITSNGIGNAWVANELYELQRGRIPFELHSMRAPSQTYHRSSWAQTLQNQTRFIYPLQAIPFLTSIAFAPWLFGSRFFSALANAIFSPRENMRCRLAGIAHFFVACYWVSRLHGVPTSHIHSQWINSCGTIGMYGAWLLDVPFSFTGHAADLFRDRVALEDKIRRASFIVCISSFHADFYRRHGAKDEQLIPVYCGIDPSQFQPAPDGRCSDRLRILASGRLVEKKGFTHLVDACKILSERGLNFECTIAGSGPLRDSLCRQIMRMNLAKRVTVTGDALAQEDIPKFMHGGDIFCLPCVWASDNDVDGLPQMLMEAMACGLPVISTRLVGIPDLVIHEETGLLVSPNRPDELADAIERLMKDRKLADRLAKAGREHVLKNFDIRTCLEPLLEQFRLSLGMTQKDHRRDAEVAEDEFTTESTVSTEK